MVNTEHSRARTAYLDYLRVFATIAVMIIHISGHVLNHSDASEAGELVLRLLGGISGCCVPLFVMISGALFLPRDIDINTLWGKYILRIAIAFFFWSAFYSAIFPFVHLIRDGVSGVSFHSFLKDFLSLDNHYHLWYLPMTVGLYLCLPIYKKITESDTLTRYFLILSLVFSSIIPTIASILSCSFLSDKNCALYQVLTIIGNIEAGTVTGYSGYFVFGFFLAKAELDCRKRRLIYCLGLLSVLTSVLLKYFVNAKIESQSGYFSISCVLLSSAVFVLFKYCPVFNISSGSKIKLLSEFSFGAYLIHIFVLSVIELTGIENIPVPALLMFAVDLIIVAAVSYSASFFIHQIPFLKKWIV